MSRQEFVDLIPKTYKKGRIDKLDVFTIKTFCIVKVPVKWMTRYRLGENIFKITYRTKN